MEMENYQGKVIDGILITESGILSLAHLGIGDAKRYLDQGKFPAKDSNGNSPRDCIKLGGYVLDLENINLKDLMNE